MPKPNYVSNKWNYLESPAILQRMGAVSLGWSDLFWIDESLSPILKQDLENNALYLNQLAVPLYSFWDEQLYTPVHALTNYATVLNYPLDYTNLIKNPNFDFQIINEFSNDIVFAFTLNLRIILTLSFIN
jgi:hypothetical protein